MQSSPNINAVRIYGHLELDPGTDTSGPLRLQSGTLTTGVNMHPGMIEFLGDRFYFTKTTGTARETIAYMSDVEGIGSISSVTGTLNRISIGGTSADPTFDISSAYVGQTSITTLGTIATGTWHGAAIGDTYISSASTWNAKQNALSGTGLVRMTGSTVSYDNSVYLTANQSITLSGEASGSGSTGISVTLDNTAVISKLLTGLSITGGAVISTDSILSAIGKLQNQLNSTLGGVSYQGSWNAATNSPTLASGTGTKGRYYVVSVAGSTTIDTISDWKVGDWIIYNGTAWQKVDNTDNVISVNGYSGIVALTTADISENTNLYFTSDRAISSPLTGYSSAAGTITSADTILTAIQKLNGNINALPTLSGTTNRITVTGTTNKAVDISSSYVGQTSITTLGTITAGTWQATSIADTYISSAATWNAKQAALNGTGLVRMAGTTVSYDNSVYLTANQSITLSGEASGSGTTGISVTLDNASVISKLLTGYTSGAGVISSTDSILSAIQKLNGNIGALPVISGTTNRITVTSGVVNISASYVGQTSITTLGTITAGTWTGTAIGDTYISSAATWNAKQAALNGTGLVRMAGTTVSYDNSVYLTANQSITLSGEASGTGTTAISVTLTNASVISKVLTGLSITGGAILSTDTILAAMGKLQNQLNSALGGVSYQGSWNANTNSPALASGTGTKGHYYVVTVAGTTTIDTISDWKVGDWIIYNGTVWQKVDNTDNVISVNGYSGIITLTSADIAENTKLFFTEQRVRDTVLTGYTSGAGTISAADSILSAIQKLNGNIAALPVISGTTNRITVTSGVVNISASYVGQTSITTLGTITSGTWTATSISTTYTDAKIKGSATTNGVMFATGTDTAGTNAAFTYDGSQLKLDDKGISLGISEKTADYTPTSADHTLIMTGAHNFNLPPCSAPLKGTIFEFKNGNPVTGAVSIVPFGANNIDGANSNYTLKPLETVRLQCSGTAWWAMGSINEVSTNAVTQAVTFKIIEAAPVTTGGKASTRVVIPYNGTIVGWYMVTETSTTAVVDIWKANGAIPTNANSITASAKPAVTAGEFASSTTLTGWTTSVADGDVLEIEVESNNNATEIAVFLKIIKT